MQVWDDRAANLGDILPVSGNADRLFGGRSHPRVCLPALTLRNGAAPEAREDMKPAAPVEADEPQRRAFADRIGAGGSAHANAQVTIAAPVTERLEPIYFEGWDNLRAGLAVTGGVMGLALMGASVNLHGQLGIVVLVGLATKNGILIVEFAHERRDEGARLSEAANRASTLRLPPTLMTSIATESGATPLGPASGEGVEARAAMGIVMMVGVPLATLVPLLLVPLLSLRICGRAPSPSTMGRMLAEAVSNSKEGSGRAAAGSAAWESGQ